MVDSIHISSHKHLFWSSNWPAYNEPPPVCSRHQLKYKMTVTPGAHHTLSPLISDYSEVMVTASYRFTTICQIKSIPTCCPRTVDNCVWLTCKNESRNCLIDDTLWNIVQNKTWRDGVARSQSLEWRGGTNLRQYASRELTHHDHCGTFILSSRRLTMPCGRGWYS